MMPSKYPVAVTIFAMLFLAACEIEKTEYERILDDVYFDGFKRDYFILHNQSISYYSPEVNKVFPDIYTYQNGKLPGNGIHSFYVNFWAPGLISLQDDNKIEFIDVVNFISEGIQEIEKPRNIFELGTYYCMVSFGEKNTGGIAMVDLVEKKIEKTYQTGIQAGRIFGKDNKLYVFSDGKLTNDSTIEKFSYQQNSPFSLNKLDSFSIGIRPVDFVETNIPYDAYSNAGLAILCKGNSNIPASIVLFDLVTEKVIRSYSFKSTDIIPENLFWFPVNEFWLPGDQANKTLASYINNKLYTHCNS